MCVCVNESLCMYAIVSWHFSHFPHNPEGALFDIIVVCLLHFAESYKTIKYVLGRGTCNILPSSLRKGYKPALEINSFKR